MRDEMNISTPLLMTEAEAERRYGIPGPTWRRWRHEGNGPPFIRAGGRTIRYRVTDVEQWLEARTVQPTTAGGR